MFTLKEVREMTEKMSCGYNTVSERSIAVKLAALKNMMEQSGIEEVKILL